MQARIKPIACHARKVKCSGGSPCNGCRQANKEAECVYPKKNRLVKVSQHDGGSSTRRHPVVRQHSCLAHPNSDCRSVRLSLCYPLSPGLVELSPSAYCADRLSQRRAPSQPVRCRLSVAEPGTGAVPRRHCSQGPGSLLSHCSPEFCTCRTRLHHEKQHVARIPVQKQTLGLVCDWRDIRDKELGEGKGVSRNQSFYSLCLNRRHSAYSLAGSAIRMAIIMGLHLNIPESQLSDVCEREHRNRLWWTAYTLDRMWAAKLGYPYAIQDDEIEVDLPLNREFLDDSSASDFPDSRYFVARIGLARISGRIIHSIYGMKTQPTSLSQRVQEAFRDLRQWMDELPTCLQIDPEDESEVDPRIRSLHLLFNQLAILATRPILLHVLRTQLDAREKEPRAAAKVPASATALSEACIRCARHSCSLLVDSWANGSFMVFDYFYTQYLFSAATVLGISSLLDSREPQRDDEQFEVAVDLLSRLLDSGNFVAAEAHKHIAAAIDLMTARRASAMNRATTAAVPSMVNTTSDGSDVEQVSSVPEVMTAGMALCDPVLQDLLDQPLPDLQFIDSSMNLDELVVFPGPP
ncbi:PUT3-like fungal specific transcription factor, putative [Aspergillus fumigatus A1163]|uniref:PUT3-like fungal specific transcription factor, putative n=1 Tax=Aspergillus fumigatus (strain CBS 144.89 / FGSC A1163 / CEA10) TaxID=451804 RepID=B0Y065_ASPFC|nr:PUT3-like fungal specific transcription factor, putative [Aspergillus fumigatus A1163]